MRHAPIMALSGLTIVLAMGLASCSNHDASRSIPESATTPPTTAAAPADTEQLPVPEALTDVMYRLAEPAVPGADKLQLVQNVVPTDAPTLEKFATALRDGGFTPVTFEATDIRSSDAQPEGVLATIKVTTTNPENPGEFAFPMEFRPNAGGGWQLSRETADMLLAFGNARTNAATPTSAATSTISPSPTP